MPNQLTSSACVKPPPPPSGWWREAQKQFPDKEIDPFLLELTAIEFLGERGEYLEALKRLQAALKKKPLCPWALFYLSATALLLKKTSLAKQALETLEKFPAEMFTETPELSLPPEFCGAQAAALLDNFLENNSKLSWALALKAVSLRYHMRYEEALPWMERAAHQKKQAALLALCARFRLNANASPDLKMPQKALAELREAARRAPKAGWIRVWLGEALRHQKKYAAALFQFNAGLRLSPDYPVGLAWRAGTLRALKRPQEALQDLDRAIILHFKYKIPGGTDGLWAWALNERHWALRDLKHFEEAARTLCDAHTLNTRYVWTWQYPARSLKEFEAGLKKNPESAALWAWMGKTELDSGDPEKALRALSQSMILNETNYFTWAWRGEAFLRKNQLNEAASDIQKALHLAPGYAPALISLGNLQSKRNAFKEAAESFLQACQADPVNASAFAALGCSLIPLKRYEEAGKNLLQALRIHPKHPQAAKGLAELAALPW